MSTGYWILDLGHVATEEPARAQHLASSIRQLASDEALPSERRAENSCRRSIHIGSTKCLVTMN